MKNINTAANLAQIILGLPVELQSLPVFVSDCDCGRGPHEVNSLCPYRDHKGRIYLEPSSSHYQVTDILNEYNKLRTHNESIRKRVEKACADGVEVVNHTDTPDGWDNCPLKAGVFCQAESAFNPKENKEDADGIVEFFTDAVKEAARYRQGDEESKYMRFFRVGYPGNRNDLPFNLTDIVINMDVTEMNVTEGENPCDSYMHLKLHFNVTMNWTPDLGHWTWKDMDVKYDRRDVYEFDDKLTLLLKE